MVPKKAQKFGNTGSPCSDKPALGQGGGGGVDNRRGGTVPNLGGLVAVLRLLRIRPPSWAITAGASDEMERSPSLP